MTPTERANLERRHQRSLQTSSINPGTTGIGVGEIGPYSRSTLQKGEIPRFYTKLHWAIFLKAGIAFIMGSFLIIALAISAITEGIVMSEITPALLLSGAVWAVVCFLSAFIRYKASEFTVTNKRLIVKTGLIQRQTHEMFLSKIESIKVDQGLFGRLFDSGTIVTYGTGGTKQKFINVSSPIKLRSVIQEVQVDHEEMILTRTRN